MAELGYEVAHRILDKYGKRSMCMGESGLCTAEERHQQANYLKWKASKLRNWHDENEHDEFSGYRSYYGWVCDFK